MSAAIDYNTLSTTALRLVVRVLNKCKTIDASVPVVMTGAQISVLKGEEAKQVIADAIAAKTATPEKVAAIAAWAKDTEESPKAGGRRSYARKPSEKDEGEVEATVSKASLEAAIDEAAPTELPVDNPKAVCLAETQARLADASGHVERLRKEVADTTASLASLAHDPEAMLEKAAQIKALKDDLASAVRGEANWINEVAKARAEVEKELAALIKAKAEEVAMAKALASVGSGSIGKIDGYKPPKALLEEVNVALSLGKHILLVGPAGTGKSSLVKAITKGQNLIRLNLNGQTGPDDLIGHYLAKDGETVWIEGALPKAMKEGRPLLLDEVDFCVPEVLSLLHPVTEAEPMLVIKEHDGEEIFPKEGFRVFATANSLGIHDDTGVYTGTQAMNHAFLSRFSGFFVDYPTEKEETTALINHGIPRIFAEASAKVGSAVRSLINSKALNGAWGIRHSLDFACFAMKLNGDTKRAFDMASRLKFSRTEVAGAWEAVQRVVGTKIGA